MLRIETPILFIQGAHPKQQRENNFQSLIINESCYATQDTKVIVCSFMIGHAKLGKWKA